MSLFPGSSIVCTLGVGCESGVCYAEAHGQPEQCGVTIVDGIDLSTIPPLTEQEADEIFAKPTISENYDAAMDFLAHTYEHEHAAIHAYVTNLKRQINNAYGQGRSDLWIRPGFGEMGG